MPRRTKTPLYPKKSRPKPELSPLHWIYTDSPDVGGDVDDPFGDDPTVNYFLVERVFLRLHQIGVPFNEYEGGVWHRRVRRVAWHLLRWMPFRRSVLDVLGDTELWAWSADIVKAVVEEETTLWEEACEDSDYFH